MTVRHDLRPDFERTRQMNRETRSAERLSAHYVLEQGLAERLRAAAREERANVYSEVYAELFASLPDHPQHTAARTGQSGRVASQVALLEPLLDGERRYLEIGCGDAAVTFAMAGRATIAYGLDVTAALVPQAAPQNFRLLLSDGVNIPLPSASVDLAYSNQLMEHLHPDDAGAQLREIVRVLAPGGKYLCRTPSRLSGPHDISVYFDYEATGFHLCEYDYRSLRRLLREAGFAHVRFFVNGRRRVLMPYPLAASLELVLGALPRAARVSAGRRLAPLLGVSAIASKGHAPS
ncbi:MAG: methyltransferase domain-containing protein [Caulobacteraceae bacterium]|nr:methyltransferase domain-containing protein [Caulobacteraceae bacterium]